MQHRGPPAFPISSRAFDVILLERLKGFVAKGVDPDIIDTNMPELTPAPQAPQNPHAPPGTDLPRLTISAKAFSRSISPPAFLYAVSSAAPTINMNTPELQYITPGQVPQQAFDGSPVQMTMNIAQPVIDATNGTSYQFTGNAPTFSPNIPVVSANAQQTPPETEQPTEETPSAKRVEVTKKVRQVPVSEKVKITVRHGK